MDSVESHYAAQRDDSPPQPRPPLRIPKRTIETSHLSSPSPKRFRNGLLETRFVEGRREESMSKQGQDIQNLTRQEFQKRLQMKLLSNFTEDSIELESRGVSSQKTALSKNLLTFGNGGRSPTRYAKEGKVIPVKPRRKEEMEEDSDESNFCETPIILAPPKGLSGEEPSIILVPGDELQIPKDKKIPMKHTPKISKMGSRALVIPAAKPQPAKKNTVDSITNTTTRTIPTSAAPSKFPLKSANFTMGSIPVTPNASPRRKSQRITNRTINKTISPVKPRVTRSVSSTLASRGKELVVRQPVQYQNIDIQVPVKFDGLKGKRKYAETNEVSPAKRMRLNEVISQDFVKGLSNFEEFNACEETLWNGTSDPIHGVG